MNNKIVLAFAIAVVGVIVDCRSSERQNEDAAVREANQELNDYLAGSQEVTDDEVKQAIEQLETSDGTETVDGTELLREAEGGKRVAGLGSFLKKMLLKLLKKGLKSLGPKILKKILGSGDIIGALSEFGLGGYASQLGSGTVTDLVESMAG